MTRATSGRAHLIAGGFPPGSSAGHDHDYARLRLLGLLAEQDVPASVANDFADVEKWLPVSRLLITYVAGPYPDAAQCRAIQRWLEAGGHWLGLHGTSGGRAERVEGLRQRRTVKTEHHALLGSYFLTHPPICKIRVDVRAGDARLTRGLGASFDVEDEPYFIELPGPGLDADPADRGLRSGRHVAHHRHPLRLGHLAAARRQDPRARLHARRWATAASPTSRSATATTPPSGRAGPSTPRTRRRSPFAARGRPMRSRAAAQRHRLGRAAPDVLDHSAWRPVTRACTRARRFPPGWRGGPTPSSAPSGGRSSSR